MRLLHSTEWRFEDFFDSYVPPYAILSHRWGKDEILYQELLLSIRESKTSGSLSLSGNRFFKIEQCRKQAARDHYKWVWIDTCCINKDSSAELSEAINSMYRWYRDAGRCYVHLFDVDNISAAPVDGESGKDDSIVGMTTPRPAPLLEQLRKSEWFTRG